ncbi:DUF4097 family beta strand repeat-containing protein [Lactobacillus helsingborgensis]|uniref:DUF4097 family beta strand repeat-containing protein n=1 Tax=Lactobacillus helsingborgensis TaxID=1218494 RepID=UPI002264FE01|nr:DUF4097 family beta strand repeat-containing protein [Lactobacillus helsingborgensis]UZX32467.1 DUF2807 domain-containing protein [Lactobacillus helsingborgensis]
MKKIYKLNVLLGIAVVLLYTGLRTYNALQKPQVTEAQATQTTKRVYTVKKFNKIKFSSYRPNTEVTLGKKYQVTIKAKRGGNAQKIKTKVKNKQLTIYDEPEKHFNDGYYEVTITVPSKNALKEVSGFLRGGCVVLEKLNIPFISLKSNIAYMSLDHISSQNVKLKIKHQVLDVSDSNLRNSSINIGKGNMTFNDSKIKTKVFIAKGGMLIDNCTFLGNSSFVLNKGVCSIMNKPKMSYDLRVSPKHRIVTDTKNYNNRLLISVPNKPTIKVTSKNANIEFFK